MLGKRKAQEEEEERGRVGVGKGQGQGRKVELRREKERERSTSSSKSVKALEEKNESESESEMERETTGEITPTVIGPSVVERDVTASSEVRLDSVITGEKLVLDNRKSYVECESLSGSTTAD